MRFDHRLVAAAALFLACAVSPPVHAEVRVSGSEDNVVLRANNATMPEILSGVESALHLKVTITGPMTRQFTGVYSGPLRRVLSRLLDGVNYIVSSAPDGMVVTIVSPAAPRSAVAGIAQAPAARIAAPSAVGSEEMAQTQPQGWTPTEDPFSAYKPGGANAGPAAPRSPAAQAPARGTAAQRVVVAAADETAQSGVQGWMPTEDPFKAYKSASPGATAPEATANQAQPGGAAVDQPEVNNSAQGWVPTGDPFAAYRHPATAAAPAAVAAKAAPQMPDMSGLRPAGAMMNALQDVLPAQGLGDSPDLLDRQMRSSKMPGSLTPMTAPPSWDK